MGRGVGISIAASGEVSGNPQVLRVIGHGPEVERALRAGETWEEFLEAGGTTAGFPEGKWQMVSKIRPGDVLLAYVTGISRWIGVLEAVGEPLRSNERIWASGDFPCRVPVNTVLKLDFETAIPVTEMRKDLELFRNLANPNAWSWHFYTAPKQLSGVDGRAVCAALGVARDNPQHRPFNSKKLKRSGR